MAVVEGCMSLTLASSGDGQVLMIRDHLLPLVREHGTVEIQRDAVRLTTLQMQTWTIEYWTPFNELSRGEASSPGYRHALERQHTTSDLPYGLNVGMPGRRC
jgi:hypothetical protein